MLNGFTQETAPLSDMERAYVPIFVSRLREAVGRESAVYNQQLQSLAPSLSSARVRKIINFIRTEGLVPCLVASSKGYYIAESEEELREYEESLRGRADAIMEVCRSIERQRQRRYGEKAEQGRLF